MIIMHYLLDFIKRNCGGISYKVGLFCVSMSEMANLNSKLQILGTGHQSALKQLCVNIQATIYCRKYATELVIKLYPESIIGP